MEKEKKPRGKYPKKRYDRKKVRLAYEMLYLDGLSKADICDRLGIERTTLWKWFKRKEFIEEHYEIIKKGRVAFEQRLKAIEDDRTVVPPLYEYHNEFNIGLLHSEKNLLQLTNLMSTILAKTQQESVTEITEFENGKKITSTKDIPLKDLASLLKTYIELFQATGQLKATPTVTVTNQMTRTHTNPLIDTIHTDLRDQGLHNIINIKSLDD